MTQPNMSGLPGADAVNDTLEFVRNLWGGGMKMPGMTMPSMSIEEIEKQIADLKAVESWLTLNMNMLRGTIQALEVQAGTLTALKSMSDSMAAMVKPAAGAGSSGAAASAGAAPAGGFDFSSFAMPRPAAAATGTSAAEPAPAPEAAAGTTPPSPAQPQTTGDQEPRAETDASAATPFADPAAWWNLLQDQFKRAVDSAMAPVPAVEKQASTARPAAKKAAGGASPKAASGVRQADKPGARTAARTAAKTAEPATKTPRRKTTSGI